ncbi:MULTISPECIES: hypothetical protein [Streptomyces]|uniref:hypothetical protein n=1 Tax=Streptomyces TaxID=1883 RepID=UPI00074367EF|nr:MULTISPECIES: hypothetical protein [Streptomyces]KUL60428.1 hypothetical protein ADL32_16360 [Streptomyces albidoflavus]MCO6696913.1 hypothetical protein [Streptomyces sp. Vc17.3-30]MEE1727441.1 hypothetical protein [Streptomyces sp. JV186]
MDTLTESAAATASTPAAASPAAALRKLYFLRFAFAAAWAALLLTTAGTLTTLTAVLLVAYPLFDVGCAVADLRSARPEGRPVRGLYVNAALSTLTAVGLAVAATSGIPAVLRVWGAWAITAGLVQLAVGVARRGLGGQWAMVASGGISTLAGASFVAQAGGADASLGALAGYAFLGGVFFLVSALRLGRTGGGVKG